MEISKKFENKSTYQLFLIIAMSTAILLVTPVLILLFIGYLVDKFFHTAPFYMLVGASIGFVSGVINVFRMVQLMQKKKNQNNAKNQLSSRT